MKIPIKGVIVSNNEKMIYEMFGFEVTTPDDVNELIEGAEAGEGLEVVINSPGGDVFSGSEIYTALMDYKGPVETKIVGIAASAASIIAMAGGIVKISPTAEIMIHNVTEIAQGDYRDFEHEAEVLKDYNKTIANAYTLKSGMSHDELLSLMDKETWLTPQKAKEYDLVDEIMFDEGKKLAAVAGIGENILLPDNVINKMRDLLHDGGIVDNENADEKEMKVQGAKLDLLKLRSDVKC
jgi:ATP-dependent Clp endopeptidase proteolytic subunit ClpP